MLPIAFGVAMRSTLRFGLAAVALCALMLTGTSALSSHVGKDDGEALHRASTVRLFLLTLTPACLALEPVSPRASATHQQQALLETQGSALSGALKLC